MRRLAAVAIALVLLAACDAGTASVTPSPSASPRPSATAAPSATPVTGAVEPAPGSDSEVYAPNPGAIVVAIDAGHGGCLDWGVPDPSQRGEELAEKTMTLLMAQRLRDRLEADGIGVLMIRDGDVALAGDLDPDFGCEGPPWRDVDGDGNAGFEESGRIRTRDELQARIDMANLAAADAFVSIHINSPTEAGQVIEIAFGQTFYDDETPWGPDGSASLADAIQRGAVAAIDPLTTYTRQDRGTEAVAYYAISRTWADGDTCEREGDEFCKPQRGLLMPSALAEVGSITLRAEHDLLASAAGQDAVADGLFDGLVEFFGARPLAGRIGLADAPVGAAPQPVPGDGPPFWPPPVPDGPVRAAAHEYRHRGVDRGLGARRRMGADRCAVPCRGARECRGARRRDPGARARRVGRRLGESAARAGRRASRGMDLAIGRACIPGRQGVGAASALQRRALKRCAPHQTGGTRRYRHALVRNPVAGPFSRCYHAPSMRSGHRPPAGTLTSRSDRQETRAAALTLQPV